jgi:hypothetical protein
MTLHALSHISKIRKKDCHQLEIGVTAIFIGQPHPQGLSCTI